MSIVVYIAVMAVTTYLIRVIPFVAVRGKIKSRFINSVLYYIPFAVLSAMTFCCSPCMYSSLAYSFFSSSCCFVSLLACIHI